MSEHLKKRLKDKNWTSGELNHLSHMLKKVEKNRKPLIKKVENILFWCILLFAILCSLSLSFVFVFLFIFIKSSWVYAISAVFGFMFGMLFEVLLRNIDWIETKHHCIGGVIIFLVVILNLIIFSSDFSSKNSLFGLVDIQKFQTILVGVLYCMAFVAPFILNKITAKRFY